LYASACTTTAQQIWQQQQQHYNQSSEIHSISQVHLHRPYTHAHVHTHTHPCTYTQRDAQREWQKQKSLILPPYMLPTALKNWCHGWWSNTPAHTCVLRRVFACWIFLNMDSMH
jgi:hypothetical protein